MSEQNKWERVSGNQEEAERIYRKSRSFMSDVWFRFRRKPTALLGFILVLILLVFCLAGPYFTPYTYSEQNNKMICKTKTFFYFVCKNDYSFSVLLKTAHKLVYLAHSAVIQVGVGFIQNNEREVHCKHTGNRKTTFFAAG